MREIKKVFIAGGTGFLGYPTAELFLSKGIDVDTIALGGEINNLDFVDKRINMKFGNLFEMNDEELTNLFKGKGYDAFIYALGPDDRVTPNAPAYQFFHDKLVEQCYKIMCAVKKCGIRHAVVLSSYFAYFDNLFKGNLENITHTLRQEPNREINAFLFVMKIFLFLP